MCFSSTASFGAGIILTAIGVVSVKKAGKTTQFFFALIPLFFALQQLSEGFVWLSLMHSEYATWQSLFIHSFLFFAYIVWPIWVPLSILLMETNEKRKKILGILLAIGIFISLFITCCFIIYPVTVSVHNHHIEYEFNYPHFLSNLNPFRDGLYFIATLPAAFVSTRKRTWLFGVILCASYIVSRLAFKDAVASVWCYFAAVLSAVIIFIITPQQKPV